MDKYKIISLILIILILIAFVAMVALALLGPYIGNTFEIGSCLPR